jgi:hypothetical protein
LNAAAPKMPANPTVPANPAWNRWDGATAPVPTPSASGINASKPQRTAAPDVTDKTLITPGIRLSDPNRGFGNDYVQAATTDLFSTQDYNAKKESDRVKIGKDIVRRLYRKRSIE